ncbi:MAG: SDR family NAD(P)-dependent oxidoreductase [Desulfobacterales bacterium]|nr:SDR family NAD(P)-dependent oxidoreductase [Desulfobacterales bacterium]
MKDSVKPAAQEVSPKHGKLDIFCNNAVINPELHSKYFHQTSIPWNFLEKVYATNVFGVFVVTRAFPPSLLNSDGGPAGRRRE